MDNLMSVPANICLSKVALAAGTTTTISTTGTTIYGIRGKAYSKAAITNGATPTTDANTGLAFNPISANQGTLIVIGLDTTGAINAMQGSVAALDVSGNFIQAPLVPAIPNNVAPIGYIVLKGGSTLVGTFLFGTNNLSGVTGMTYTFQDLISMVDRPQVA